MSDLPNFSQLGYRVIRQLGHNRTNGRITYLATKIEAQQPVVIKQFEFASSSNWPAYEAYNQEIQVLRGLNHSGIPRYLDCFETPTGLCLVQEYKQARSLAELRSFDPNEVKKIAVSLLTILVYLQNRLPSIIHRDIKPENILVDEQTNVYLVDFGFARIGGGDVGVSSMVKGTIGFMPPEQLFNRQLTAASDLYSVGATLVCLVTGIKSAAITDLIDDNYRLNFRDLVPQLSFRWIEWLEKMVQLKPKDRFSNASAALEALNPVYVIRTPEVKLSQSTLEFKTQKLGEKLTQTLTVNNPIPETLLSGSWEVASHDSDPPHTAAAHSWISFQSTQFEDNHFDCKITVNTSRLLAGTTYSRRVLLHTNSLPATHTLTLKVQTAPIPVKTKQLPYLSLTLLVVLAAVGTWVEAAAWSDLVAKFGTISVLIAAMVTVFSAVVGAATAFVAKTMGALSARVMSRFKSKLRMVDTTVAVLIAGLMALFVARFGAGFRTMNVAAGVAVVDVVIFMAGFKAESVAERSLKRGFSALLAVGISILATALGIGLGIGCQLGFFNPVVIFGVSATVIPLGVMILYPPLERARLIARYRKSMQYLIKP